MMQQELLLTKNSRPNKHWSTDYKKLLRRLKRSSVMNGKPNTEEMPTMISTEELMKVKLSMTTCKKKLNNLPQDWQNS